jgi:glycosyltransferase involved in cell wall biosynthesis
VLFLPRRPATEMGPVLQQGDVLLVHLKDEPLFRITIPSKTQAYLAVGRPVLMAVEGDAAQMVAEAGAGLCCRMESPESLAAAIENLYHMTPEALAAMGERGRTFYHEELSMAVGADRFEALFRALTSRG